MNGSRRGRAFALGVSLFSCGGALACSVDRSENPAYRDCSGEPGSCEPDEHCHRGYCVPDDDARARSGAMLERPLRAADGAVQHDSGTNASDPAVDAGTSSTPPASEPPASSEPDDPPADPPATPPPSGPPPSGPPPSEPPEDPDPPPAQCTPRPEACNRADDDCDGRSDEGFALQTDAAHCGACGRACRAGERCCGGACVDTSREPAHCGECGHECTGLLQACCTGVCKTLCLL